MDKGMDGWMDGWIGGRVDGWTDDRQKKRKAQKDEGWKRKQSSWHQQPPQFRVLWGKSLKMWTFLWVPSLGTAWLSWQVHSRPSKAKKRYPLGWILICRLCRRFCFQTNLGRWKSSIPCSCTNESLICKLSHIKSLIMLWISATHLFDFLFCPQPREKKAIF